MDDFFKRRIERSWSDHIPILPALTLFLRGICCGPVSVVSVRQSVCHKSDSIKTSLNGSNWFWAQRLPPAYPKVLKRNSVKHISKINSTSPNSKLWPIRLFLFFRHGMSIVAGVANLARPSPVYHTEHPPLFTTQTDKAAGHRLMWQ